MATSLADFPDRATDADIVVALEGNMLARYQLYRLCPEIEVHDDAEMLWTLSSLGYATFNTVHRAQLTPETSETVIANVMRRGSLRGVPLLWWLGPLSRPRDLGARLAAVGWQPGEEQPGMALELARMASPSCPPGLRFERVLSASGLVHWWEIACQVNGRPRDIVADGTRCYSRMALQPDSALQCYLGWLNGQPVATACLVFGAGVAGLGGVGTLPQVRMRGIGTAMTLAALDRARELGYQYVVLRASEQGEPLYRRLGFREYGRFGTCLWNPLVNHDQEQNER